MGNMSYCRFRNTLGDLRDCWQNIDNSLDHKEEAGARLKLVKLCQEIAEFADEDVIEGWTDEFNEMDDE